MEGTRSAARPRRCSEDDAGGHRRGSRGAAARGAGPARLGTASVASAGAGRLLRGRQVCDRPGLGRRNRPREAAPGKRHSRARSLERPDVPGRRRRGVDRPAHPGTAGHPRRRQARQPDLDAWRPRQAGRFRAVIDARDGRPAPGHGRLPRARAARRGIALARKRRVRLGRHRLFTPDRCAGHRPRGRLGRSRRSACRLAGDGDPGRPRGRSRRSPGHSRRAGRALALRLGLDPPDRGADVRHVRHRGLDGALGHTAGGDGARARPPLRADRPRRRGARRPLPGIDGRG